MKRCFLSISTWTPLMTGTSAPLPKLPPPLWSLCIDPSITRKWWASVLSDLIAWPFCPSGPMGFQCFSCKIAPILNVFFCHLGQLKIQQGPTGTYKPSVAHLLIPAKPSTPTCGPRWDSGSVVKGKVALLMAEPELPGLLCFQHLEIKVFAISHSNIDDLKASINQLWTVIEEDYVKSDCCTFRKCLNMCIANWVLIFQ